jgi:serine/threonine protein kinase
MLGNASIWKFYTKKEQVGKGVYGKVYKAVCNTTNKEVAVKKTRIDEAQGVPHTTLREIALLKRLPDHENIIKYFYAIL